MDHNLPQVFSETTDSILLVLEYNNAIFVQTGSQNCKITMIDWTSGY